jgi:2'-5' RNA ligase
MYFLAIVLPQDLNTRILKYKQHMFEEFNCKVGLKSPAHITLIPPFWMHPDKEQELLSSMDQMCQTISSFPIVTNDFSTFKPRTIFIDVPVEAPLKNTKKNIDSFFSQDKSYGAKIETRPFHPHITIATRDLHKKAFAEAWNHYKDKTFKVEFMAEGLSTLRHNQKTWDVIHTSDFLQL